MNRSDVGMADLYLFPERKAVADFTFPHLYDKICFMVSKPVSLPSFLSLVTPLKPMTWLAFIMSVLVILVIVKNFPKTHELDSNPQNDTGDWINVGFVIQIILDYSSSYLKHVR